jgi:hypothetical protein
VPSSFRNPVLPSTQQHKNKLGSFSLKLLCANGSDHLSDEPRSVWHASNTWHTHTHTTHTHTHIYIYIYMLGLGFLRPSALRKLGVLGCDAVLSDKELRMNLLLACSGWKSYVFISMYQAKPSFEEANTVCALRSYKYTARKSDTCNWMCFFQAARLVSICFFIIIIIIIE